MLVLASGSAVALLIVGGRPARVWSLLWSLDEPVYAGWYLVMLSTPLLLLAGALVVRRRPGVWVVGVVLHLVVVVATVARVEHWLSSWVWPVLGLVIALGLWSVAESLAPRRRSGAWFR